jgi:hypothetical protein
MQIFDCFAISADGKASADFLARAALVAREADDPTGDGIQISPDPRLLKDFRESRIRLFHSCN